MQIKTRIKSAHTRNGSLGPTGTTMIMPGRLDRISGRMLIVFGPILVVGALGALVAIAAAHSGWHVEAMRLVATGLGASVTMLAVVLFYQQTGQRRAADLALQNVVAKVD